MTMLKSAVASAIPGTDCGKRLLAQLDRKVELEVENFKSSKLWATLSNPETSTSTVMAALREVYWEIHCYQPATTKAGFQMIGGADAKDMKIMHTLLLHKWDEVEHREWAWDGYVAFGGDASRRTGGRITPGAFAVAAVWERMAKHLSSLSYVGAEYLFEALTARITPLVVEALADRKLSSEGMRFIKDHAIEDQKHQNLFNHLIVEIGERYPHLESEILYCYDCFNFVYPAALWNAAVERAYVRVKSLFVDDAIDRRTACSLSVSDFGMRAGAIIGVRKSKVSR